MIQSLRTHLRCFARDEGGTASVEFIIVMPIYITVLTLGVELGLLTLRHTLLERGMDMAVRDVRLGTGTFSEDPGATHDTIKDAICDYSLMLLDCQTKLKLEMQPADIRQFNAFDTSADCTDTSEETNPVYNVTPGQQNELMLLRACLRYDPLFPGALLGSALKNTSTGEGHIIVTSGFVQEPL